MKPLKSGILVAAAMMGGLLAPSPARAQDEVIHHVYMNRTNIRHSIHDIERESNTFRQIFEKRYKTMFVGNYRRTDESLHAIQSLDKAFESAQRRNFFGEKPRYIRDDVQRAVERARELDRRFRDPDDVLATMSSDWRILKEDINQLAAIYELPGVDD